LTFKLEAVGRAGFPDIYAIKNGKSLFIEVKAPNRKPTALQEYRLKELKAKGASAHWVDNIAALYDILKKEFAIFK